MNIILAGMPGSGKTTVSEVFKRRGRTVVDTDAEIVKEHGAIPEIFARFGEAYFRDLETEAVRKVCTLTDAVIATGGGCLLRKENADLFRVNGKIVYLKTQVKTLTERVGGDSGRPLLQGDTRERLQKLYDERAEIYERSADIIIQTDGLTPEEVANKITEYIG